MSFGHCIVQLGLLSESNIFEFLDHRGLKEKNKYSLSSLMYCLGALDQDAQNGPSLQWSS